MTVQNVNTTPQILAVFRNLAEFDGQPAEFWKRFVLLGSKLCRADNAVLYWSHRATDTVEWRLLAQSKEAADLSPLETLVTPALMANARREGASIGTSMADGAAIAIAPLQSADPAHEIFLLLKLPTEIKNPELYLGRIMALCEIPFGFEQNRKSKVASRDATRLAQSMTLLGKILDSNDFDRAAIVLANGLSELFACETVSVCWRAREGQKLRAASHSEKLDRRSQASAQVEEVAQEALIQKTEVVWPSNEKVVNFAADRYSSLVKPGHILTLPMIETSIDGKTKELGAVVLERQRARFSASEQWALRLHCEMVQQPLAQLFENTKWLPVRVAREFARSVPKALRAKTGAGRKLLWGAMIAMIATLFIPIPFSITGTALLKTDAMAFVGAPYDGFMEQSSLILGDHVQIGDPLFALSKMELVLERSALLAELAQANRDVDIRRSLDQFSEMQVALAKAAEVTAQLLQIDQRLASSQASAPIAGVVIEGEPAKQIGQAVRRGDVVVTLAALSSLYVEAAVSERDLSYIMKQQNARLTLLAKPRETYEMDVLRIIPAAAVQDADNVFPVRMTTPATTPEWWLPGMTGVVKISVGRKPIGWVISRRAVDYLRLFFWW